MTRDALGRTIPKQYCDFGTGQSLIHRTLDRALQIAPHDRVVVVVSAAHREWWESDLDAIPAENIIVQPHSRGTAAGILLPLLHIAARDSQATVIVLPSDHHVSEEDVLALSVADSIVALDRHPHSAILLGMTPEHADTEYGWVLPDESDGSITHPVAAFVEKPGPLEAARLMGKGAVWNSFMFAARATTLIEMFADRMPGLLTPMRKLVPGRADPGPLEDFYRTLDSHDFSREVLQSSPARLRVLAVTTCGWTDLGTPERLARALENLPGPAGSSRDARSAA